MLLWPFCLRGWKRKWAGVSEVAETKIIVHGQRAHSKASERYVDVTFVYADGVTWDGSIPIENRRTGTDLNSDAEIEAYLLEVQPHCHPATWPKWKEQAEAFWAEKPGAGVTKSFFDALADFRWTCVTHELPANPNWARRVQDIKENGYTLATDTARFCSVCNRNRTQLLMVPLPRGGVSGYETWSPELRARIVRVLQRHDVYENRKGNAASLLPDHKFPEIRWDEDTRRDSLEVVSDEDIQRDFQLMSNQRNLQKREVCRRCYQTGERGAPFGVRFWHEGDERWPEDVPRSGKKAEPGCFGCGWYDLEEWRRKVNARLVEESEPHPTDSPVQPDEE